jgi:hypothetical protein
MHRYGELNCTEACAGVAADYRTGVDDVLPNLISDLLQVFHLELPQIRGRIYLVKKSHLNDAINP